MDSGELLSLDSWGLTGPAEEPLPDKTSEAPST